MSFIKSETGAVTVDWVVLTAALVGLGLAAMSVVSSGVEDLSGDTKSQLESTLVYTTFDQRSYSGLYAAHVKRSNTILNNPSITGNAADQFAQDVAGLADMSDADLLQFITDMEDYVANAETKLAALNGLDPETVTVEQLASASGIPESNLTMLANYRYGGSMSDMLADRISQEELDVIRHEHRLLVADERGLVIP